jgi:hypothetical protein
MEGNGIYMVDEISLAIPSDENPTHLGTIPGHPTSV